MNWALRKERINQWMGIGALMLMCGPTFAVNPVPGFYGGIMLGVNYSPTIDYSFTNPTTKVPVVGTVFYSVLGNIAGQLGYRCDHYRIEGELLYNDNPIREVKVGSVTYNSVSKFNTDVTMKARTDIGAFMLNGFYDFYSQGQLSYFSPYVGAGLGYALVMNSIKFYQNQAYLPGTSASNSEGAFAGQVIAGIGYFLDDFTSMGLDFRYLATQKAVIPFETRTKLATINITLNGSFDRS